MRIAVVTSTRRKVGGIEAYLDCVISALVNAGHQVAFWHEVDKPTSREQIALGEGTPTWCVAETGAEAALAELRRWSPDLIYAHGLLDAQLEKSILEVAPAVFFAHAYYGTCISGAKSWSNGTVRLCNRAFGPLCLIHYFPHRCGGLNPLTMFREYRRQERRLELLQRYRCILTASEHMQAEYENNGLRAHHIPLLVPAHTPSPGRFVSSSHWKILFLGRMNRLKGGLTLLESLPKIRAALNRPLQVTFAGDGPDRQLWENHAERLRAACAGVSFNFPGWVTGAAHEALLASSDLLVMPSLWPEPFGLIGPQAGLHGLPAVAFAVGGIPDWLKDGVNGYLAPANPPTATGLAEAVIKCLRDPATYNQLRSGAATIAQTFDARNHVSRLVRVFEQVTSPDWQQPSQ